MSADEAIAAARRAVVTHHFADYMGLHTARTNRNTPVVVVGDLGPGYAFPGKRRLLETATKRCGRTAALEAWAVGYAETLSPVCCQVQTVFVVPTKRGLRVF